MATRRSAFVRKDKGLFVGVWMMRPGEDKIVARRLREVSDSRMHADACDPRSAPGRLPF